MGVGGLDPVQALLGASLIGSAIGLVLALASGQFIDPRGPWGGGLCVCHKLICPCGCLHIFYLAGLAGRAGICHSSGLSGDAARHDLGGGAFGGNLHTLYLAGLGFNAVWYFSGAAMTFIWGYT